MRSVAEHPKLGVVPHDYTLGSSSAADAEVEAIKRGPHISAEPQPAHDGYQHSTAITAVGISDVDTPTQLWGGSYGEYPASDPMNVKWGEHAAPPNLRDAYRPPPPGTPVTPAWYLQKRLEDEGFVHDSMVALVGAPEIIHMSPPTNPPPHPQLPLDFSVPPPNLLHVAQ